MKKALLLLVLVFLLTVGMAPPPPLDSKVPTRERTDFIYLDDVMMILSIHGYQESYEYILCVYDNLTHETRCDLKKVSRTITENAYISLRVGDHGVALVLFPNEAHNDIKIIRVDWLDYPYPPFQLFVPMVQVQVQMGTP